jgi:hypothetical protein
MQTSGMWLPAAHFACAVRHAIRHSQRCRRRRWLRPRLASRATSKSDYCNLVLWLWIVAGSVLAVAIAIGVLSRADKVRRAALAVRKKHLNADEFDGRRQRIVTARLVAIVLALAAVLAIELGEHRSPFNRIPSQPKDLSN